MTQQCISYYFEQLAVFDGLFNKDDLDKLRSYTQRYGKYYSDDSVDLTSDNVQWIAGFPVNEFVKTKLWKVIEQVATFFSG